MTTFNTHVYRTVLDLWDSYSYFPVARFPRHLFEIYSLFTIKPIASFDYSLKNFFLFDWWLRIQLPINSWKLNCGVSLISYLESLRLKDARLEARLLVQQQPSLMRVCSQFNIEKQVSAAFQIAHSQVHQFLTLTKFRNKNWYQLATI